MKKVFIFLLNFVILAAPLAVRGQKFGDFSYESSVSGIMITRYNGADSVVDIPATIDGLPVTGIGDGAFYDCTKLTSVTIPNTVTSIGNYAFNSCSKLMSVTIPNSVTSIGLKEFLGCYSLTTLSVDADNKFYSSVEGVLFDKRQSLLIECLPSKNGSYLIPDSVKSIAESAFYYCTNLTNVTIPSSVASIGNMTFYNCLSLRSITIPNSVTSIGYMAFFNCKSLSSVTIPKNVISIESQSFENCASLSSVTIPDSVKFIGDGAFEACSKLMNVTIPNSVTSIGVFAFMYCNNLTNVAIPNSVTTIGHKAFFACTSLTSVSIPDSVKLIGGMAFGDCWSLTSATIPYNVTSIGESAFFNCTSLKSVTIPNSVTSIGSMAFQGCASLTSVKIPNSVTTIGSKAFAWCGSLNAFTVDAANMSYSSVDGVLFDKGQARLIQYPSGKYGGYLIPNSVTSIGTCAFINSASLPNVIIPNTVTSIGEGAFSYCAKLANVTIPDSVTSIEPETFGSCTSLTSVKIPNSVTSIGSRAFYYCTSLTSVKIPNGVTSIGSRAFYYCPNLKNVTVPNTVTTIGEWAFYGCTSLTSILFEGNALVFNADPFYGLAKSLIVHYFPNTMGWGSTYYGHPAVPLSIFIVIVKPIDSGVIPEGATMELPVWIRGTPAPNYQWYFNGQPVVGATNDTLVISSATANNAGAYMVVASSAVGTVTNGPATWGVNNVTASNYFALSIADTPGGPVQIQSSANISGPWTPLADLTPTNNPQTFVDPAAMNIGQRYYRTTQPARLGFGIFRGWDITAPAGSVQKIEYVDVQTGYNNWQFLTNLTLPSSPYLYVDTTATNKWPRYYRTTSAH